MFKQPEFWVGAAFLAFIAVMIYFKVPAVVAKVLDDRAEAIRRELDEARRLREEAQQVLAGYQRKHREAEDAAAAIIEQAKREGEAFAAETRQGLKEMLERRSKLAEERIARAEAQALSEVRAAAVDAAVAAAERVLREKAGGAIGTALIDDSIRALKGRLDGR